MLKADLHIHSTVSDGSDTIGQLIGAAEKKGLDAIAVTDHDTLAHLPRLRALAAKTPVKLIGGVEISAFDPKKGIKAHILGFCIQDEEAVAALCRPLLEMRSRNCERQAEILRRHGYELDETKLARADGKYLYKQHLLDYLTQTGQISEMFGEFYRTAFKNNGICDFDISYIDVQTAVAAVKEAGGLAVLAHGGQQQNFYLIPSLIKCGLDGLELNHPANSEVDKSILRAHAERYGLFLTGGSDYHGRFEPGNCGVGDILSEESGVLALCSQQVPPLRKTFALST